MSDQYYQGYDAYYQGYDIDDNPYMGDTIECNEWIEGYTAASFDYFNYLYI